MDDLRNIVNQIFKNFRYPKWIIDGMCIEVAFYTLCGAALVKYLFF